MANKIEELKNSFKQGATPNESHYSELIDLLTIGYKAAGNDKDTPAQGNGLQLDKDARLAVKPGRGVTVDETGISANVDKQTLVVDKNNQLAVNLLADKSGLDSTGGLHIKTGGGLAADTGGLQVSLADNGGLGFAAGDKKSLRVKIDEKTSGLEFDKSSHVLKLKVPEKDNFLTLGPDGLSLTAQGIESMKSMLAQQSSTALASAKAETADGFKTDTKAPAGSVEAQIAGALNAAYHEGWTLNKAREAFFVFLKKQFEPAFKNKTVKGTAALVTSETTYSDFYTKNPKDGGEPLQFTGDCLTIYSMAEDGTPKIYPRVKGQDNAYNYDDGIYVVIGKMTSDGVPSANGDHITQYAQLMVIVYGRFTAAIGGWDLSTADLNWTFHPRRDPYAYHAGYTVGHDAGVDYVKGMKPQLKNTVLEYLSGQEYSISLSSEAGVTPRQSGNKVYYIPGQDDNASDWTTIVKKLEFDGTITLTGKSGGGNEVKILAVERGGGGVAAQIQLKVRDPEFTIVPELSILYLGSPVDLYEAGILKGKNYDSSKTKFTIIKGAEDGKATIKDGKLSCESTSLLTVEVIAYETKSGALTKGLCVINAQVLEFTNKNKTLWTSVSLILTSKNTYDLVLNVPQKTYDAPVHRFHSYQTWAAAFAASTVTFGRYSIPLNSKFGHITLNCVVKEHGGDNRELKRAFLSFEDDDGKGETWLKTEDFDILQFDATISLMPGLFYSGDKDKYYDITDWDGENTIKIRVICRVA